MRVPCRLPDQDTMHGTKPELRPTEPSIELSEDVKERLRAAGDVEGFGRSQVWETATLVGTITSQSPEQSNARGYAARTWPTWPKADRFDSPASPVSAQSPSPLVRTLTMSAVPAESFAAGNAPKFLTHQIPNYT
ncbi:hypothetical protein MCOR02_007703 [Pyricularia oryzae]|nr:hypothetical protein MCOR02_007703 [Pyricularia oryzae]KAI6289760.1 hypothetical protein MCOR34_010642 [Pyricularia oryzae]KAI6453286.1 hypothetical protein MCOR17_009305 [Pyricularia oryzae]